MASEVFRNTYIRWRVSASKLRGPYSFQNHELLFFIKRRSILVDSDCSQECLDFFIFRTILHIPAHLTGKNIDLI